MNIRQQQEGGRLYVRWSSDPDALLLVLYMLWFLLHKAPFRLLFLLLCPVFDAAVVVVLFLPTMHLSHCFILIDSAD